MNCAQRIIEQIFLKRKSTPRNTRHSHYQNLIHVEFVTPLIFCFRCYLNVSLLRRVGSRDENTKNKASVALQMYNC